MSALKALFSRFGQIKAQISALKAFFSRFGQIKAQMSALKALFSRFGQIKAQMSALKALFSRFGQIKAQMSALKALCNPVWISVSSEDPFQTVFKLQSMEEEFERVSGSFAMEFEDLLNQVKVEGIMRGSSTDQPTKKFCFQGSHAKYNSFFCIGNKKLAKFLRI